MNHRYVPEEQGVSAVEAVKQAERHALADAEISAKHLALGGDAGWQGGPISDTRPSAGEGYERQYAGGRIFWAPGAGAHEVHGAIAEKYLALGGPQSVLGYPTTDESPCARDEGRYNHFVGGSIYWMWRTGAHAVYRPIVDEWARRKAM